MKKAIFIICLTFLINVSKAQNVTIPDVNFLNALIFAGVDTSGDSIIQTTEAIAVTQLTVGGKSITNLTGIEAFTNLVSLDCGSNQLNAINVTSNTKLVLLGCQINTIGTIDVSKNTLLEYFDCGGNYTLTTLNLSKNTVLKNLDIIFTGITSIDLSHNLLLESLLCSGTVYGQFTLMNSLKSLDVSKNVALNNLSAGLNPQLKKICVNTNQFANKVASWSKDSICVWDTICAPPIPSAPPVVPVIPVTPSPVVPIIPEAPITSIIENKDLPVPKIIRCFDILGNEIDPINSSYQGILIYQYSDGSTKKVVKME